MYFPMTLEETRAEITRLDEEIIELIAERQALGKKIAAIKHRDGIPVHDHQRKSDVLAYVMQVAKEKHIDPVPIKTIFETLIAMNEKQQRETLEKAAPSKKILR